MWGVADNTNNYWRKGQSALLYDEAYAAKPAYYEFRQGILDGLATTSLGRREWKAGRAGLTPGVDARRNHRYYRWDGRIVSGPLPLRGTGLTPRHRMGIGIEEPR